ncbi:MAG: undecaprenyl phosphate translocase family protein [Mycoplasma sp.]
MAKNNKKNNSQKNSNKSNAQKPAQVKATNDLLKKYGLEANAAVITNETKKGDVSKQKENIVKKENVNEEKQTIKATSEKEVKSENTEEVTSGVDLIGWKNPKTYLLNIMYGIFMAISDAIPGYSGGTTLSIIGFYEKLITNFKNIFAPPVKKDFWKYLLWFLPFAAAWIGVLVGVMKLVDVIGAANMGVVLVFLFGTFSLFSIPIFYLTNKNKMINFKEMNLKSESMEPKWNLSVMIVTFLIIIGCGIAARFIPETKLANGDVINGVTFAQGGPIDGLKDISTDKIIIFLLVSLLAGFVMLIPGLSGSLVLFMTGLYPQISSVINGLFSGDIGMLPYLILIGIGITLGLILSSLTVNFVIKKWSKIFYSISFGFVVGSFIAIFISLSSHDYSFLSDPLTMGLSIGMIPIAIIINVLILVILNETKKINYPKYRVFNKESNKILTKN